MIHLSNGVSTRRLASLLLSGALALAAGSALAADPGPKDAKKASTPCFFINQWEGWKSPSPTVIYLGVRMHDVYKVELSSGSYMLNDPDVHLVSVTRGPDSVCTALDLQLAVADSHGFREPLIAARLTKLTPEEVAAIPKKYRPN